MAYSSVRTRYVPKEVPSFCFYVALSWADHAFIFASCYFIHSKPNRSLFIWAIQWLSIKFKKFNFYYVTYCLTDLWFMNYFTNFWVEIKCFLLSKNLLRMENRNQENFSDVITHTCYSQKNLQFMEKFIYQVFAVYKEWAIITNGNPGKANALKHNEPNEWELWITFHKLFSICEPCLWIIEIE